MAVQVQKSAEIEVSASDFVDQCSIEDVAQLVEALAGKFDREFAGRAKLAGVFADGLSERGCRFLAEVVCHHYHRNP